MTGPVRVQRSRAPGARLPEGAITVDRTGRWRGRFGNPFDHGTSVAGRTLAVAKFKDYLATRRDPPTGWVDPFGYPTDKEIREALAGRDLACYCPLDGHPCHADELLRIANADQEPPP